MATTPSKEGEDPQSLRLTFGVELEAKFVFHEELLLDYLNEHHPGSSIVKCLSEGEERLLRHKAFPSTPYRSWALANAGDNPNTVEPSFRPSAAKAITNLTGTWYTVPACIRAYYAEPLEIAARLLSGLAGRKFDVYHDDTCGKQVKYPSWTVTGDVTLSGIDKQTMTKTLESFVSNVSEEEVERWDSYGVELVSPVYSDVLPFLCDLRRIVAALQASRSSSSPTAAELPESYTQFPPTPPPSPPSTPAPTTSSVPPAPFYQAARPLHTSIVDLECGHHVHVGLESGELLPLRAIQTLACLAIAYESEILSLHHPSRRANNREIESNRENFLADPPQLVAIEEANSGRKRWFAAQFQSLEQVRACLFDRVDQARTEADKLRALCRFAGEGKGHLVNFSALKGGKNGERPRTVEFRHHVGTLDVEEVRWWVQFCLGFVRLASRYGVEGQVGSVKRWEDSPHIEDLWEEMGFQEEGRQFYREKREAWKGVKVEGEIPVWEEVDDEYAAEWEEEQARLLEWEVENAE